MYHHGSCHVLQRSDTSLCNSVLKVSFDPTKCDRLTHLRNFVAKCLFVKDAVVGVIVLDFDIEFCLEMLFETFLGFNGLICLARLLIYNVAIPRMVVDKDGCVLIPLSGNKTAKLSNQSWSCGLELIH